MQQLIQEVPMPDLALILFGAPRIEVDNVPLHVERQKALALLTFLAVTRLPHRRDILATLLWPDLDQEHARSALRRTLSALRQALPRPLLVTLDATIAVDLQAGLFVDVIDFRRLLAEADTAVAAASTFHEAAKTRRVHPARTHNFGSDPRGERGVATAPSGQACCSRFGSSGAARR
jgi:DNA-binding SARP family transcriptional activator